jgi:putative tricarboxylic transport membrane protein
MKERVISLIILVFSMVYLAGSISIDVGTIAQPGPGFLPAGIAIALIVAAGVNVYKAFRTSKEQGEGFQVTPVAMAACLFVYPIILKPFYFVVATFVVLFILLRLMKFKSLPVSLVTALVITIISYYIFANLLGVVLPSGPIEEIISRL